ncbi:MAG: hypothetical protein ABIH76_04765 [Candidatus Bathyarchaeota archaeon]
MEEKKINPLTDVTKFINKDNEPFDIYIDGKLARHLEAGEEQVLPVFVAKVGAKHLVDRILQKKGIKDSIRPTPERNSLLATIIPDIAEEVKVKPLTEEEFRKKIEERLGKQEEDIKALGGKVDTDKVKKLEKEVKKLKKQLEKK